MIRPGFQNLETAVIDGMQRAGIMAVTKHFPGIGRTTSDSHVDMPHPRCGQPGVGCF